MRTGRIARPFVPAHVRVELSADHATRGIHHAQVYALGIMLRSVTLLLEVLGSALIVSSLPSTVPVRFFVAGMARDVGTTKRCASVVLGLSLLFGTFLPSLVLLDFQWNRAEIIRDKCVQRSLPEEKNCCKGSCHLKKELEKVERSTEGEQHGPRIEVRAEPAIVLSLTAFKIVFTAAERTFEQEGRVNASIGYPSITEPVPWA